MTLTGEPLRWKLIAATVLVPALMPASVAMAKPYLSPSMQSHGGGPPGGAMAVAWTAGQHPVIVSTAGVRFCHNDPCTRYVQRNGGPPVMDGYGTAGIGADGSVVKAALTGGAERHLPNVERSTFW